MKILLQNMATKKFLTATKEWTLDPEEAESFRHAHQASRYCAEKGMRNMQILLRLPSLGIERTFPVIFPG